VWKVLNSKELEVALKRKKFLFGNEALESKKFRLSDLSGKCVMEKTLKLAGVDVPVTLSVRQPVKTKEMEQTPIKKLIVDTFLTPFRGGE